MTTERDDLTIWGAVGPNGQLVKSSVGTFKSVAARWALRRGNYEVVKLGTIPSPGRFEEETPEVKAKKVPDRDEIRRKPKETSSESDMEFTSADTPVSPPVEEIKAPEKYKIDRSFFGRRRRRK
jgi:hypothetical protein